MVRRQNVDLGYHEGSKDLQLRKHFCMFLANKVRRFARPDKSYTIRVDPIPSSYEKADEAMHVILKNKLVQEEKLDERVIESLRTVGSRDEVGVQLADLLVGAVVAAREREATSRLKRIIIQRIADHLGWDHLHYDTYPDEWKLNIWRFTPDPKRRSENSRPTKFRLPVHLR